MSNFGTLIMGRCPRCKQGRIFKPGLYGLGGDMNPACTVCGLRFLREAGYFMGAMYVSYALGVFTVLPVAIILTLVIELPVWLVLVIMAVQTLVSVPLFLRYSRLIWLWLDHSVDPETG